MELVLNTISLSGLVLVLGSAAFYVLALSGTVDNPLIKKRHVLLLNIGGGLYLFSLIFDGVLDYFQGATNPLGLNSLNIFVVPVYMFCFYTIIKIRNRKTEVCLTIAGILMLILHILPGDLRASPGALPYISHFIHLGSVSIWFGCILMFLILPWSMILTEKGTNSIDLSRILVRLSMISISLLVLILLSGAILSVANVHSTDVVSSTAYGQVLSIKLGAVALLFLLMLIEYTRRPLLSGKKDKQNDPDAASLINAKRKSALLNGLILLVILIISIVLTEYDPPDTPPFLNPQTWHMNAGEYPVSIDMQPVAGSTTQIRFEIFVPDDLMSTQGTFVNYDLYLTGSEIGTFDGRALQASQNSFLGESLIPGPGTWTLVLRIDRSGLDQLSGSMEINIPSLPLISDLKTFLSFSAITYSRANAVTFLTGVLLVLVYMWLTWRSQRGRMSARFTVLGVSGIVLGMYLLMSVLLVKTYPSTYWNNPQAYTADVINNGRTAYQEECAECHGDSGLGDGPWAIDNRGAIPPLSSPHIDVHTDGEIYWLITYGIPSLDMPPLQDELSEDQRWQIIQYVRSLRHGIP
jgi:putative copper export protein